MPEELLFADEITVTADQSPPWKILIVDDEEEVHRVTKLALANMRFDNRPLSFLDAYSGDESIQMMGSHDDIAMILMDVVMETEHAGLDAIHRIRNELGNKLVRIVLRTGQPGQAPEHDVVTRYDINDYKEKTELTAKKLFTLTYTGLSIYKDLLRMEARQQSLEKVIEVSNTIFRRRIPERLCRGVLKRLTELLGLGPLRDDNTLYGGLAVPMLAGGASPIIASAGRFHDRLGQCISEVFPDRHEALMHAVQSDRCWRIEGDALIANVFSQDGVMTNFYLEAPGVQVSDPQIMDLFCENAAIALNNARMNQQVEKTQRELVIMLSEAIERRSRETGNHVRRVGAICKLLAQKHGLSDDEAEVLGLAAPLHDAGKIAIPDNILNKPGRHTPEEREIMESHAAIGGQMFEHQELPVLKAASIVASQHHERWDGLGYPNKLAGEDIHVYGRISAIADVFDALCSSRCYKDAWPIDKAIDFMHQESGKMFDPSLIDRFLENLPALQDIRKRFPDHDQTTH